MGPPIDHTGGLSWGPKRGSFWLLKMSQNSGYPQWYISTPARRSDPPFHMRSTGSPTKTPMPLVLNDLHATRRGDNPNGVHNCQNGKIVHTHLRLRFAHVVCEPWGPIYISPMSYMVHWSMRPSCTRGLNMVHGGQKMWKIAQTGRKYAHSWLGQRRHMPDLDRSVP